MISSRYEGIPEAWKNDIRFLQTVSDLSALPVAVWRTGMPVEELFWTSCSSGEHPCLSHAPLRLALEEYCRADRSSIFFENDLAVYGIVPVGSFSLTLGPAVIWSASEAYLQDYARSHGMQNALSIPRADLGAMSRYMELVYCGGRPPTFWRAQRALL